MSVSGDSTIMRHGRSQISIYDYPEHLNPFYEDDNHKRLRFWKIGKHKDENGRRSSFSLGGIKDMWTFKSFRLKKKSSSLGINKTSESPPPLRRQLDPSQCNYGTYDPRMRHTTTSNGAYSNTFERNTPYRSSLQDMRLGPGAQQQQNGFGFARNDRYRSTIQTPQSNNYTKSPIVPPRRYVYGGSVTPQPIRNNGYKSNGISRGPSQVSVSSSNPFEDDDNDVVIGQLPNGSSTPKKRQPRKKNRAPPPPVPVQVVREESQNTAVSIESDNPSHLHIEEEEEEYLPIDEILNISSLTAEIENFVQTSKNDSPTRESSTPFKDTKKRIDSPSTQIVNNASSPQENVTSENDESKCLNNSTTIMVSTKTVKQEQSHSQHVTEKEPNNNNADEKYLRIFETKVLSKERQSTISDVTVVKEVERESCEKMLPVKPEKITTTKAVITEVLLSNKEPKHHTKHDSEIIANGQVGNNNIVTIEHRPNTSTVPPSQKITIEQEDISTTSKIREVPNKNTSNSPLSLKINEPSQNVLKITEISPTTVENISLKEISGKTELPLLRPKEIPPKPPKPSLEILSAKKDMSKSRKEYFPLNPQKTENDLHRTNPTTDVIEPTPPVPRERRRSVRDIIESINRNQKLLKVNQEPDPDADANNSKYIFYTNNLNDSVLKAPPRKKIDQNYRSLVESEKEIKRMLQELETPPTGNREKLGKLENSEIIDDLIDQLTNQNNDNNNSNVFEKCTLKKDVIQSRESSPTTSNLDWNPVPKPKRTKNLSPEFKLDNNHSGNNNGHHFNYNNP